MSNTAFTIVRINHPDDLRAPKTRYAVNSYTHRHSGRRPRQIALEKQLAISWTKSKERSACSRHASSKAGRSEYHPPPQNNIKIGTGIAPIENPSPLTIEFTGIRRDPFSAYPITIQGCVEGAVDFWLKVWVPSQVTGMVIFL